MKATRRLVGELIAVLFIGVNFTAHAQTQTLAVSAPTEVSVSVVKLVAEAKALPLMSSKELPLHGTYWVVTGEGSFLLPMPYLPYDLADVPIFSLGGTGQFLVDATDGVPPQPTAHQALHGVTADALLQAQANAILDLTTQVQATQAAAASKLSAAGLMSQADALPPMPGDGSSTNGFEILPNAGAGLDAFGPSDLWLQIFMTNRSLARLLLHSPDTNGIYDVYATSNLNRSVPGLNLTNWTLLTRTAFGQTNVLVTNLWANMGFFRLGTMLDSDMDGLPDAFEILVSHTNPNVRDSNGNGVLDGDELSPGGLPWRLEQMRRTAAVVYASAPTAVEGSVCGLFTVYLPSPAPAGGMTVQYRLGGTAVLNTDYTVSPAAYSLPISAGQSTAYITVCAVNDTVYSDLDRYVEITLTNATVGAVDNSPARVDIADNDQPPIRVFALPNWVREPSSTYGTNTAAFYFVRDGDATNAVTLNFTLGGSAVPNVNYTALLTFVTFPANVRTNLLTVIPKADTVNNADRALTLTLTTATGYQMDAAANVATITIANVAAPQTAVVQVTATDDDAREAGLNPGVFTFTRTGATAEALHVIYHVAGTAQNGSTNSIRDYLALPGYVDFLPEATSTNVIVTPTDNGLAQVLRTVIVVIGAGDYSIGTNHQATVYIDDNETVRYEPELLREGVYGTQARQPAIVRVTRYGTALVAARMHYAITYGFGGNAVTAPGASGDISGQDVYWAVRQNVATVRFDPSWQNFPTTTLNPMLTLSNVTKQTSLILPIHLPSDLVSVASSITPATTVREGVTVSGALVFRRPYPNANPVVVYFDTTQGSAVYGTDYTVNSSPTAQVTIPASTALYSVPVQGLANAQMAKWRTAVVTLHSSTSQVEKEGTEKGFLRIQDSIVTDPNVDTDMDGDGITDGYELAHQADGLDPLTANNPYEDVDRDGLGLAEELALGTNPNVADAPPVYPSAEESDYVALTLRLGSAGKLAVPTGCGVCHEVRAQAGPHMRLSARASWERGTNQTDSVLRFLRGTNYPVTLSCQQYSAVLPSSQTNTTPLRYSGIYLAQFFSGTNGVYPFITDANGLLGMNKPMVAEALTNRATLHVPDLIIAADNDRDGVINFASRLDRTYATNPFTFWINDDFDFGSDDTAEDRNPSANGLNSTTPAIDNLRDLEDFTRLQFKIEGLPAYFATNGNLLTKVYLTNLSGNPSIRLFRAVDNTGSIGYLTNTTTATAQVATTALGVLTNGTALTLPSANWFATTSNSLLLPMIFEGISTGRCVITFGFASNSGPALALSRPFYLDLKPVTSLYEHWTVGDNTNTDWRYIPSQPTRTADSAMFNDPKTKDGLDYVLFVHGWRMALWERRAFASTGFKRLWHLGYQGRYGLFSWPTDYTGVTLWDMTLLENIQNYDRSEQRAWNSANGLKYLLMELNKEQTYRVRLLAHSMGNIVASEALRLYAGETNMPLIHTYVASQAASVAYAYDAVNPGQLLLAPFFRTPEVYAAYPRASTNQPFFTGMNHVVRSNRTVNFNNLVDYALNSTFAWAYNQKTKPDNGWSSLLVGTNTQYGFWRGATNSLKLSSLDQTYEIYAHVAQARSKALGCAEDSTHHIQGELGGAVNLNLPPFSYDNNTYEHSAQFNSINMNRRTYWWQVLSTFSLTNNLPQP